MPGRLKTKRRATLLMMVVGLLATLFLIVSAYIALARFDNLTLQSMQQAQAVDQVVQSLSSVVLSAMRQAWADADGNLLAGGREDPDPNAATTAVRKDYLDFDVPGYGGSRWLAGPAPVRDATSQLPADSFNQLQHYRQTVSSFDDANTPRHVPLRGAFRGLLLHYWAHNNPSFGPNDVIRNARRPFMDADGDGIADSFFVGTGSLTDIANAIAGVAARAPDGAFNPSAIGDPNSDPLAKMWLRFDEQARYEAAVKVVSHGGMVALASPGNAQVNHVWNRQFVTEMFNWIKHPEDSNRLTYSAWANARFQELAAQATSVEPFLRHRGGVLATYAEAVNRGVPEALWRLALADPRNLFYRTLVPVSSVDDQILHNRFNLATLLPNQGNVNEWNLWRLGSTLDPDAFNYWFSGGGEPNPRGFYFPRQHITTISYSDELARVIDPHIPDPNAPHSLGIFPGQPKFYLGEIAAAFDPQTGHFVEGDANNPRGHAIIRRLANYYYEMLSGYDGWAPADYVDSDGPVDSSDLPSSVVSQRQQAMMLAVNTVAFAAPRSPTRPGFIDAVWYTDEASGRVYAGYAPQLFITQVIAHCEGGDPAHIALAVELFNPNEPDHDVTDPSIRFNNPQDDFALDLTQFALSVDGPEVPPQDRVWRRLDVALQGLGAQRMTGRNFVTIAIHGGGNPVWDNYNVVDGVVNDVSVNTYYSGTRRQIDVTLGRIDSDNRIWVIDRLTLGDLATALIPIPQGTSENIWVVDYYRDLGDPFRGEAHFGGDWSDPAGVVDTPARWRMVLNMHSGTAAEADPDGDPPTDITLGPYVETLNKPTPQPLLRRAPSVPLYTMNAGTALVGPIHGDYRPASFPTVGFLLFVPRFSGVTNATDGRMMPMSDILRKQWEHTKGTYAAGTGEYPADFGHMPIFDNHQEARSDRAYFGKDRAGRIPWGLLVFDYFTTLNPYADYDGDGKPDIDLWRVPGRINVNTAPWYVLAGLPVLNPALHIDPQAASPAFWSRKSGVLVGPVYDAGSFPNLPNNTLHRFDDPNDPNVQPPSRLYFDQQNGWYRLGPYLAQAIVSHRDRLLYCTPGLYNPLWAAYDRNLIPGGSGEASYYRKEISEGTQYFNGYAYGPVRRSGGKYGLLSLGELVNVYGFESPVLQGAAGGAENTLYNPLGPSIFGVQPTNTPDFFRAVSLLALLDTHFLTTRSNTFTVYMSLMDRDEDRQQASLRVQMTVDRSNLLPKLLTDPQTGEPILQQIGTNPVTYAPIIIQNSGLPEVLTRLEAGYFNTRVDR